MSLSWLPLLVATGLEKNPSKAKGARKNAKPGPKRQQPGKGVIAVQLASRNKLSGKKILLVMDTASFHYQHNTEYYPDKKTPANASKGLNAHVLQKASCTSIFVPRTGAHAPGMDYEVPSVEPPAWVLHRDGKGKAPSTGARGNVYDRSSKAAGSGPTSEELAAATIKSLKTFKPVALESKVEVLFKEEQ